MLIFQNYFQFFSSIQNMKISDVCRRSLLIHSVPGKNDLSIGPTGGAVIAGNPVSTVKGSRDRKQRENENKIF
jgi:hypothetical protein